MGLYQLLLRINESGTGKGRRAKLGMANFWEKFDVEINAVILEGDSKLVSECFFAKNASMKVSPVVLLWKYTLGPLADGRLTIGE